MEHWNHPLYEYFILEKVLTTNTSSNHVIDKTKREKTTNEMMRVGWWKVCVFWVRVLFHDRNDLEDAKKDDGKQSFFSFKGWVSSTSYHQHATKQILKRRFEVGNVILWWWHVLLVICRVSLRERDSLLLLLPFTPPLPFVEGRPIQYYRLINQTRSAVWCI